MAAVASKRLPSGDEVSLAASFAIGVHIRSLSRPRGRIDIRASTQLVNLCTAQVLLLAVKVLQFGCRCGAGDEGSLARPNPLIRQRSSEYPQAMHAKRAEVPLDQKWQTFGR